MYFKSGASIIWNNSISIIVKLNDRSGMNWLNVRGIINWQSFF